MKRPKGMLVRKEPYSVSINGERGIKIVINNLSGWKIGDKIYQEKLDNGIMILIPENIYLEGKEND
jgi:hypothetical protein